jgi:4-hydroxy-3-methylbut-2-enyl diphosphate reductase
VKKQTPQNHGAKMPEKSETPTTTPSVIIMRAATMGYCAGVRRALDLAWQARRDYPDREIFTYGPLIHNETVLKTLAEAHIREWSGKSARGDYAKKGKTEAIIIIRAHGVAPEVVNGLERQGFTVIDATCPRVRRNQEMAATLAREGRRVIIAGDRDHGEVAGLLGYVRAGEKERQAFATREDGMVGTPYALVGQSTMSAAEYRQAAEKLRAELGGLLLVADTVCPEAEKRQEAVRDLCGATGGQRLDGVLVVGGKDSANTKRLFELAKMSGVDTELIQGPEGIPERFYRMARIGLSAGASTPDEVVDAVEKALRGLFLP